MGLKQNSPVELALNGNYVPGLAHYAQNTVVPPPNSLENLAAGVSLQQGDGEVCEDQDFVPSAEEMVHSYDDESTIQPGEDIDECVELEDLTKEGEMPLDELIEKYCGPFSSQINNSIGSANEDEGSAGSDESVTDRDEDGHDEDGNPVRKIPLVGPKHQVDDIPELQTSLVSREHPAECLWDCMKLTSKAVEDYLAQVKKYSNPHFTTRKNLVDCEEALSFLKESSYNASEALRKFKSRPTSMENTWTWTEIECQSFENGMLEYPKDFYKIHTACVQTKSVKEIIHFYYKWKKTRRFELWKSNQSSKKNSIFSPGARDFMDRLFNEAEIMQQKKCTSNPSFLTHAQALERHMKELATQSQQDHNVVDENVPPSHARPGSSTSHS